MICAPDQPVRTLADVERLERVPYAEAVPYPSTYALLRAAAEHDAAAPALTFMPTPDPAADAEVRRLTRGDLLDGIHRTANALHRLGVRRTDAVSILLPGLVESHLALWGAEAVGVASPLNDLLADERLAELMRAARARVVVALGPHPEFDIFERVMRIRHQVPGLRAVLAVGGGAARAPRDGGPAVLDFDAAIGAQPGDALLGFDAPRSASIAACFHTGGTTGSPKLARHTHAGQVYCAWACTQLYHYGPHERIINGFPLYHVAGALVNGLGVLAAGGELVIPTPRLMRDPEVLRQFWRLVERHRASSISGVPTVLSRLLEVPLDGADLSSVGYCKTGAAPLPAPVRERFERLTGVRVHETLGMTEASGIVSISPRHAEPVPGGVGIRLPYERIRIVAPDAAGAPGASAPAGVVGRVQIAGPNVFPGYADADADRGVLVEDGWLDTGDLGALDRCGRLRLVGRAKDVIIRSGHNVDPAAVEAALEAHPDVALAAAVGEPDADAGEVPVVFVTLVPGASADAASLERFAAARVDEPPARPRRVTILDALPVTAVGKVYKLELRRRAAERVVRSLVDESLAAGAASPDAAAAGTGAEKVAETVASAVTVATGLGADGQVSVTLTLPGGGRRQPLEAALRARLERLGLALLFETSTD